MTDDEVKDIYTRLWAIAERRNDGRPSVNVVYFGMTQGEGGRFNWRTKQIQIDRPHYVTINKPHWETNNGSPVDLRRELIILAHEHGHAISWERKERPAHFDMANAIFADGQAAEEQVPDDIFAVIMSEEHRAWSHARSALAQLGWTDWARFDQTAASSLATYSAKPPSGPRKPWVVRREREDGKIVRRFADGAMRNAVELAWHLSSQDSVAFFVRREDDEVRAMHVVPGAHWLVQGGTVVALLATKETEASLGLPFTKGY